MLLPPSSVVDNGPCWLSTTWANGCLRLPMLMKVPPGENQFSRGGNGFRPGENEFPRRGTITHSVGGANATSMGWVAGGWGCVPVWGVWVRLEVGRV